MVGVDVGGVVVGVVGHGVVAWVLDDVVDVGAVVVGHGPVVVLVVVLPVVVVLPDEVLVGALLDGVLLVVMLLPPKVLVDELACGPDVTGSAAAPLLLPVDEIGEA